WRGNVPRVIGRTKMCRVDYGMPPRTIAHFAQPRLCPGHPKRTKTQNSDPGRLESLTYGRFPSGAKRGIVKKIRLFCPARFAHLPHD
ncbi:MAG: hypothetical protein ACREJM_12775, partial [Candidatus Saccharimonadales bacterium]